VPRSYIAATVGFAFRDSFQKNLFAAVLLCDTKYAMTERADAEENLRVIRQLMERAVVYRAVAAPSALIAGILSLVAAGGVYYNNEVKSVLGRTVGPREFGLLWIVVLALAGMANAFFLWREAERDGRPFFSSGMRLALQAIAPTLLIPIAVTLWYFRNGYLGAQELQLITVWVAFYGLALLSTGLFAPRSLSWLGWAFLLTALATPVFGEAIDNLTDDVPDTLMALSFGFYHLIYAITTWRRRLPPAPITAVE
jgi:hypothetical protein